MTPAASPFSQAAPDLITRGYSPVTILPPSVSHQGRSKAPGRYQSGGWSGFSGWSRLADEPLSGFHLTMAMNAPGAGCGIVLGTNAGNDAAGRPLVVIALDYDVDGDALDTLLRATKASPMAKVGRKGVTRLFRAPPTIVSTSYDGPDGRICDLLAKGRQTVVPPSLTVDEGKAYRWIGDGPVDACELPIFDEQDLAVLEEALESVGWTRERPCKPASGNSRPRRTATDYDGSDPWARVNAEALADVDAWFPALGLPRSERTAHGWRAVPSYRASGTGRDTAKRKQNLSVSSGAGGVPSGIRDWGASGDDASLTAVDLVERALNASASEALTWLEERLGLTDDRGVVIALGQIDDTDLPEPLRGLPRLRETPPTTSGDTIEGAQVLGGLETVATSPAAPTHGIGREVPEHLTRVPGLVGDIADWITATARKPQPVLSLAAALGIVGTAAGRKFAGPTDSATHLYFLCTAGTGAGKNAPKKAANALLAAAGLRSLQGPGSFMSASALIQHVAQHPASLCIMDEFGVFLSKLNGRNNSSHERGISGEMRQFWSLCFEEYRPPKWASSASRQDVAPIVSPALSIVGLSTPDEFYAALQGADVVSGFANRFLVMATDRNPEDVEPSASVFDVPPALVQGLQDIAGTGGALAAATMHSAQADKPLVCVPWVGGTGSDAQQVFRELKAEVAARTDNEALLQRTAEMAVRLATIRAIGIAGERAQVSREDMRWGAELAMWSANRMIADVDAHMVESDHQARAKLVLRIISATPDPMSRTALCRKVNHRFDARTLDSVIAGLIDAGQVEPVDAILSSRTGAGRKPAAYRAVT